ncbi:RagB/SusD family nutrient uptake outer membrane protein [Carboxylicivirga sp. RSCT41]|uniref:RagB/SusD family nutrient uptake outer membrane protein n=1 Tax=Carboxylicivirga agarovorans TaxID=3417570 RepID=UPI003D32CB64
MKRLNLILLLTVFIMSACSDWLDVQPLGDIEANDQISSAEGFMEILDGAYIGISKGELYGKELTYGYLAEVATNHYTSELNTLHNYEDASKYGRSDNIFINAYNVIANLNFLLDNIDAKRDLFTEADYLGIKAEAKAIRAFIHFDLLRAFAVNYSDSPESKAIPYVDVFEKRVFEHVSASEVIQKVLKDLDYAEQNLKLVDPIVGLEFEEENALLTVRKYRFNYYAILAIKARIYQYIGEPEKASQYAQQVMENFPYEWTSTEDVLEDQVFFNENILILNAYQLYAMASSDFGGGKYTTGDQFYEYGKTKIFDVVTGGAGANDVRYTYCFTYDVNGNKNISTKYNNEFVVGMPLIKISEMFLILAENTLSSDKSAAIALLNEVRSRRSVQAVNESATEEEVMEEIIKEFRKETFLEGQYFFLNKRLMSTTLPALHYDDLLVDQSVYTFPLPQNEIEFGDGSRI